MRRAAFTLVELMVVVAITASLGGILLTAIGIARGAARRVACLNNLRQVGMAAVAYADEHDGLLPAEGNKGARRPAASPAWFYRLPPYLGMADVNRRNSVFQCPSFHAFDPSHFDHASPKSYKLNGYLDNRGRRPHYQLGRAPDEGRIVGFIDAVAGETGMGQWGHAAHTAVDEERHGGRANVLYLDMHTAATERRKPGKSWRGSLRWESERWRR